MPSARIRISITLGWSRVMTGQLSAKLKFIPEWHENDRTLRSKWSPKGGNGETNEDRVPFTISKFDATVACYHERTTTCRSINVHEWRWVSACSSFRRGTTSGDLPGQDMAAGTKREHEKSEFVAHSRHASSSSSCTSSLNRKDPSDMDVARPPVAGKEACVEHFNPQLHHNLRFLPRLDVPLVR